MDKKKFVINFVFYGCIIAILYLLYEYLLPVFLPFIIGFVFAAIGNGILKKTNDKNKRIIALTGIYIVLLLIIGLLVVAIFSFVSKINFLEIYDKYVYPVVSTSYNEIVKLVDTLPAATKQNIVTIIASIRDAINEILLKVAGYGVSFAADLITSLPSILLSTLIAVISSFYIVIDYENIVKTIKKLTPKEVQGVVNSVSLFCKEKLGKILLAYGQLMFITFVELTIGFMFMGIQGGVVIALLTTVVDILPILGTGTVLIPWALITFFSNKLRGVLLLVLYVVITVIRNFLEPKLVGESLNLHPLISFVCMIVGLKFAGLAGLLGLPLIAGYFMFVNEKMKVTE